MAKREPRLVEICCGHNTCQRLIAEAIEAAVRAALEERARLLLDMGHLDAARIVGSPGPGEVLAELRKDNDVEWGIEWEGHFVALDYDVTHTREVAESALGEALDSGADPAATFAAWRRVTPWTRVTAPEGSDHA